MQTTQKKFNPKALDYYITPSGRFSKYMSEERRQELKAKIPQKIKELSSGIKLQESCSKLIESLFQNK